MNPERHLSLTTFIACVQLQVYAAMHAAVVSESQILAGHDVVKQLHSMLPHFQQVRLRIIPGLLLRLVLNLAARI